MTECHAERHFIVAKFLLNVLSLSRPLNGWDFQNRPFHTWFSLTGLLARVSFSLLTMLCWRFLCCVRHVDTEIAIQNTDTETSVQRFTWREYLVCTYKHMQPHARENACRRECDCVADWMWRVTKVEVGRIWVAAVCFVPFFFSTSFDFELSGTRNHAVRLNKKPLFYLSWLNTFHTAYFNTTRLNIQKQQQQHIVYVQNEVCLEFGFSWESSTSVQQHLPNVILSSSHRAIEPKKKYSDHIGDYLDKVTKKNLFKE